MDVRAYLLERLPQVDALLDATLPAADEPPAALHAAMRHLVFPSGKRLRPALALAAAEAVGAPCSRALPAAAAVELIHSYSLVHDDLPCMDDDDERRGRPSVHRAFGEATAVLAGDALQAAAFEALCRTPGDATARQRLAAVRDLADAVGSRHLVGGQVDDLAFDAEEARAERVESVHARKSAALIAVSVVGGARLAGADGATLARLRRFGESVGIAFQIADDLVDEGEADACSMVRAIGAEAARERAEALLEAALAEIDGMGERAEPLRALARYAVRRSE
ncbi:MAG: polyprenyl synthetase family protein [Myxococcota bacterium]